MAKLVRSVICDCSIKQLRAKLQKLDNRLGCKGWVSDCGERLVFGEYPYVSMYYKGISNRVENHKPVGMLDWKNDNELDRAEKSDIRRPATRASWTVLRWRAASMRPEYHPLKGLYTAAIEAYEESDRHTHVDFLDAYDPEDPKREYLPIGAAFEEFSEMVAAELGAVNRRIRTILLLSADPSDADRLRIDEEFREIREKLQLAKHRDSFDLHQRVSVRPADLSQALLDINPHIVHFSGHGMGGGELCFEDVNGRILPIEPDALASLFEQFADHVSCVLLNACYSEVQARAIAQHIKHVIGMSEAIGDKAAIAYSIGFYQALGAGRSIEEAHRLGCAQVRLQGIAEHMMPILVNGR